MSLHLRPLVGRNEPQQRFIGPADLARDVVAGAPCRGSSARRAGRELAPFTTARRRYRPRARSSEREQGGRGIRPSVFTSECRCASSCWNIVSIVHRRRYSSATCYPRGGRLRQVGQQEQMVLSLAAGRTAEFRPGPGDRCGRRPRPRYGRGAMRTSTCCSYTFPVSIDCHEPRRRHARSLGRPLW